MSESFKSIRFENLQGQSMGLSNEETLARRLNSWYGWKCSAGSENIFVSSDGNVYGANCAVGGVLGNVYHSPLELPTEWITCTRKFCMCGQDMQLRKTKKAEYRIAMDYAPQGKLTESMDEVDWVGPFHYQSGRTLPKFVTWDLGRRCNYACDYCDPSISNHFESHRSWGSLKVAADRIIQDFGKSDPMRWIFTGGEPTLNPSYMELVKYLFEREHDLHTQTNGSRPADYYAQLIRYSSIGISLHLQYFNEEKFLNLCRAVLAEKEKGRESSPYWFGIRIMVPPGSLPLAERAWALAESLPHFKKHGHLFMSPVYGHHENKENLAHYETAEFEAIVART